MRIIEISKLKSFCENEKFKGWDPYDGLNSKLFRATPLFKIPFFRICWIQIMKRSPINFRRVLGVPKNYNAKGIALFLRAYCNLYKYSLTGNFDFGEPKELKSQIEYLANLLLSLKTEGYSGDCWGYDFDWQSKAFFLPAGTPTVVASSFAVDALLAAYEITNDDKLLNSAISCGDFVLKDLKRIDKSIGFMFSYSPLDNRAVYNATLLGSKLLSQIYSLTKNEKYRLAAKSSVKAVLALQHIDGAFPHSDQVGDSWRDSFHTGFKLESLIEYQKNCDDVTYSDNIKRGYTYWLSNFFCVDGTPKYYDDSLYPIDLHCPAQFFPTVFKNGSFKNEQLLADKIVNWVFNNMFDHTKGYFFFQKTKYFTNKVSYSRWPQAWMLYGLSFYILSKSKENEVD